MAEQINLILFTLSCFDTHMITNQYNLSPSERDDLCHAISKDVIALKRFSPQLGNKEINALVHCHTDAWIRLSENPDLSRTIRDVLFAQVREDLVTLIRSGEDVSKEELNRLLDRKLAEALRASSTPSDSSQSPPTCCERGTSPIFEASPLFPKPSSPVYSPRDAFDPSPPFHWDTGTPKPVSSTERVIPGHFQSSQAKSIHQRINEGFAAGFYVLVVSFALSLGLRLVNLTRSPLPPPTGADSGEPRSSAFFSPTPPGLATPPSPPQKVEIPRGETLDVFRLDPVPPVDAPPLITDWHIGLPVSPENFKKFSYVYGFRNDLFAGRGGQEFHTGVDIPGPQGTPILAAADGVVFWSGGGIGGFGNLVAILHNFNGQQVITMYGHNSEVISPVGTLVKKSQVIARMGSTGMSTGPHSHFEVRTSWNMGKPYSLDPKLAMEQGLNVALEQAGLLGGEQPVQTERALDP